MPRKHVQRAPLAVTVVFAAFASALSATTAASATTVHGAPLAATKSGPVSGVRGTRERPLRRVRQNITAFDGDLGRITICGKSAGGLPEYALFTDPSTRSRRPGHHGEHLLHHLIARGGTSPGRFHRRQARLHRRLLSTEQERGADPGRRGCYAPIVHEAPSLPVDHKDAVRTDRSSHVPVLIGSNADEARSFALSFIGATKQQ